MSLLERQLRSGAEPCGRCRIWTDVEDLAGGLCPGCIEGEATRIAVQEGVDAAFREMEATRDLLQMAAEAAERRIESCHEEVACPRCLAPLGERCRSLLSGQVTKHPHRERWTLVVPAR